MLTALTVSSTAAYIFVPILVAIPILYWIILALTGRLGAPGAEERTGARGSLGM